MDNLTQITDHANAETSRLIDHFKSGTFEQLVEGLGGRWQELEDALFNMLTGRYIANAVGESLLAIGEDVGVTATYTTDDAYRVFVYAKIAENRSNGTRSDVYNILSLLGLSSIKQFDVYPASITVNYTPNSLTLDCDCVRFILEAATLPVEIDITEHTGSGFGFLGDSAGFGFGVGELGASS